MTVEEGRELETWTDGEHFDEGGHGKEDTPIEQEAAEEKVRRSGLPWIGALANPRLGPIVVINESGYLVPMLTAGDLLRSCKYFWRESQE